MNSKKKYLIIGALSTLILMLGFTFAYWVPTIMGEGKKITVRTGTLAIRFTDSTEINVSTITPGWSTSKTFTVENESNINYEYNISIENLVNTFVLDYLEYRITSSNGYNMEEYQSVPKSSDGEHQILAYSINVPGNTTHSYTIEFRYRDEDVDQSEDMGKEFRGNMSIEEGTSDPSLFYNKLLSDNPTILERTDFDNVFTTTNTGTLYKATGNETEDINGDGVEEDVYYFAGNAQNNWVKFGKDQDNADLYWRIIRTNEDGGIRLLYIGPDKATTSAFIKIDGEYMSWGSGMYNSKYDNTMYVGYMYGSTGNLANNRQNTTSSRIKQKTDEWYSKTINIKTDVSGSLYDRYVSKTAIYCNDRSTNSYSANGGAVDYAAYKRLYSSKVPSYKCGNDVSRNLYSTADVADKFSVSIASGGNGKLEHPIAQMTADEVVYAGGKYGENATSWYYYNSEGTSAVGGGKWWTMSPYRFGGSGCSFIFLVAGNANPGFIGNDGTNAITIGIRPVLSLKSCVKHVSGDGSSNTPYEVSVNSTCANKEN